MELVELKSYIEILSGFAFNSKIFNDKGEGIPLIRIRDVGKNVSKTFFSGSYDEKFVVNNGDYLIGMDGDFRMSEWQGGKALLNQRVCKIWSKSENILNDKYLLYLLPRELKFIEDTTSFATVKHLSIKKIKDIKIPLPPLPTQKKIASILDEADTLRQLNKQLITKYDALTQSLFLEMFGDPVANPMGWEKKQISLLLENVNKIDKNYNEKIIDYIDIASIDNSKNIIISSTKYSLEEKPSRAQQILTKGDILFSTVRPNLKNIAINNSNGFIASTGFFIFRTKTSSLNPSFLFELLKTDSVTNYFVGITSGANYPAVKSSDVKKVHIVVPPIHLQNQFAERVAVIEQQKAQAQQSLQKSEDLFNSLLQKAFKGELVK